MTDWKAANLAQRAACEAMDEQKRREAAAAQQAADIAAAVAHGIRRAQMQARRL